MYSQMQYLPQAEEELGITLSTPVVNNREVVQFTTVDESGLAYKSGLRNGDILKETSLGNFAKSYLKNNPFSFVIIRNGEEILISLP